MDLLNKDLIFKELIKHQAKLKSFVEFEDGKKTFDNYMELKFFFEEIFHRKIDLVTPKSIKPLLKESIFKTVQYAA